MFHESNSNHGAQNTHTQSIMLHTDYLVIGSGAASMAFCDKLLSELASSADNKNSNTVRIILVDRHSAPGGHWNDAYDYIQLHAPSITYVVSSSQLEGNWLKLLLWKWQLPFQHYSTKQEILTYYQTLMDRWIATGRVQYYPECKYNFEQQQDPSSIPIFMWTTPFDSTPPMIYTRKMNRTIMQLLISTSFWDAERRQWIPSFIFSSPVTLLPTISRGLSPMMFG